LDLGVRFLEGDITLDAPGSDPTLAGRQGVLEPRAGSPLTDRMQSSPPARTTQIVTKGRRVPSGRRDAMASSSASPMMASSSLVHEVIDASPFQ